MNVFQKMALGYLRRSVKNENDMIFNLDDMNRFFNSELGSDISEITYFTCLKVLSESVGKLSIHLKDANNNKITNHDSLRALKIRPNRVMTPTVFKGLLEYNRNHFGNAYALVKHNSRGELECVYPLQSEYIKVIVDDGKLWGSEGSVYYEYRNPRLSRGYIFKDDEIIHLKGGITADGIIGKSVREVLASTLKNGKEAQRYLNNLYEKGLTAKAVIKYTGDLDTAKKKRLTEELLSFGGSMGDGIIPLPLGMDLQTLDLKLSDSQFYELRKFNALQISAAFGVKPNHLNNYEKSSYANSEMQNLTFYIDTLLYILTQYEEEFNYKLLTADERDKGLRFEFNVASILRGDLKTQAESLSRYISNSIYTINEAREKAGLTRVEGGDKVIVNGSYVSLDDVGVAYAKNQEKGVDE